MANLVQTEASVNTKIVTSEDGAKTFSITKTVEGVEGSHVYFILLYPTRTAKNCYIEDSTNNHLLNHLEELGLNGYTIINLFSKVTQSRLSLAGLEVDEGNMEFIQERVFANLSDDSKVVIAWGNTQQTSPVIMKSKQRILELWEKEQPSGTLYQLTADGLSKDNIGVHPLYMGIRYCQAHWKLAAYPYKKILKELKAEIDAREAKGKEKLSKSGKEDSEKLSVNKGGKSKKDSK